MCNRLALALGLLLLTSIPRGDAAPAIKSFSGQALPPIFRHIGLVPVGTPGLGLTLWQDFDRKVTTIVFPIDELDAAKLSLETTRLHFMANAGKWELGQGEGYLKKLQAKFPKFGWTGGWIFDGDGGAMLTNLREFDEFRKKLDGIRPGIQAYLTCRPGQTAAECLPKSLQAFFAGMVWDLTFKGKEEAACLVNAVSCKGEAEAFFERLRDSEANAVDAPKWSLRVPLMKLAQLGPPLDLLRSLYARFINENQSVHFLLEVDAATAKAVLADQAPYRGVRDWLIQVTRWQIERNVDLGSNLDTPFAPEGLPFGAEATKLLPDGIEASFRETFALTRFTVTFAPDKRPRRIKVYGSDGHGLFYLRSFALPPPDVKAPPEKLFTETLFFPRTKKLVVKTEGGRLTGVGAVGWPQK